MAFVSQMPLESKLGLALPVQDVRPGCVFGSQCAFIEGLLGVSLVKTVVTKTDESAAL